jgi:hypothetical protein
MTEQGPSSVNERRDATAFEREAQEQPKGLLREYVDFLRHNKKWWLIPIIVALLLVGVLIVLGSSAAAPFIYTLF